MKKLFTLIAAAFVAVASMAQTLVSYEGTSELPAGVTISGTTAMASVKIHLNKDAVNCIQLKNGYTTDAVFNSNAITLSTEGGFKAGDVLSVTGFFNNSDDSKVAKAEVITVDAEGKCTVVWTSEQFLNGRTSADEPTAQTYTLVQDMETIVIGRNGNTGTNFSAISVTRPEAPSPVCDVVTFEGNYFTALIDDPQYMGAQLYGDGTYNWTDEKTTLSSELTDLWGDGMFWGGGVAISNYVDADIASCDFNKQLAVPVSNGSENFAVVYNDYSYVYFNDGAARTIMSMDVCPTSYLLNSEKNGDSFTAPLEGNADAWFKVTVTADEDDDNTVEFYLCKDGVVNEGWKTVDLSSLGDVTMLTFSFSGSDTGSYGLNTPAYFAMDNVKVVNAVATSVALNKKTVANDEAVFGISGRQYKQMQSGINIVRKADGTVRKVLVK